MEFCIQSIPDKLRKLEERRNEVLKTPLSELLTEEDKRFTESWRLKNDEKTARKRRTDNPEVAVSKAKKTALTSMTTSSSCATTSPPVEIANTSLSNPACIVSSSMPISQPSTVPHLTVVSSVHPAASLFQGSSTHPVESVSSNALTSILPDLSSSPTPATNDHAFPILPLPSSSFASTVQSSVSPNIPPNDLQSLTPLNLSVTSDHLSFPAFFSDLPITGKNSLTTESLYFSPVSTNSNSFSFPLSGLSLHNRSFDSVGQSYPRSSTPVRSTFPMGVLGKDSLTCSSSPSSNFYNILPGQAHPESRPNFEGLVTQKVNSLSQKVDMVLANQRTIIDYLINQQPTRNMTPVISTAHEDDDPLAESHRSKDPPADPQQPLELTVAELEVLKN